LLLGFEKWCKKCAFRWDILWAGDGWYADAPVALLRKVADILARTVFESDATNQVALFKCTLKESRMKSLHKYSSRLLSPRKTTMSSLL
jgi:hypothetical protein